MTARPGGTVRVKDINPGPGDANPSWLTVMAGSLYFGADDGVHGTELWKSNGTKAGTVRLTDINPSGNSDPGYLTAVAGKLYFSATDGSSGLELWKRAP